MKATHKKIMDTISQYLESKDCHNLRFTQVLFNLNINEFADDGSPEKKDFLYRDSYNDSDEKVLERIKKSECYGQSKR